MLNDACGMILKVTLLVVYALYVILSNQCSLLVPR
jgi:hypothetical protein